MMYKIVIIIGVWLGTVLSVLGQNIGPRFLILTCSDIEVEETLKEATQYLKASHISYTLELDKEELALLLQSDSLEPYIERKSIQGEQCPFVIIESDTLGLNSYETFTTSQEPVGIRVDVATENIKTVIQNIGDLEVPISPLPKQYVKLLRMPKSIQEEITKENVEQQVIDISRFNRLIRWVMIIAIIVFIYFIREGRRRETRKFYKKGKI